MVFLSIWLSFFSFLFVSFFGSVLRRGIVVLIALGLAFFSFIIIFISYFFLTIYGSSILIITDSFWIDVGLCQVEWIFLFDSLSMTMLVLVTFISFLVHLYSCEYMSHDPGFIRFISYLALFTFFMELLVTSGNFLILFLGWEGVGLSSFLLISFWFERPAAVKSALKAIIVNRVGDVGLLLGIAAVFFVFRSLDFSVVFLLSPFFESATLSFGSYQIKVFDLICILFFLGVVGKSAQIGLHTWLPDAMEGPTPVSALIHAATMVTAGVFFLVRCSVIFELTPTVLVLVSFAGGITAIFSATVALVQNDLKKVVAYSTCSQLGYMVFSCGLSHYDASIYHLINHGFFKALLFLGAGVVIHSVGDEQDMRKMGALVNFLPFTYIAMLVASLSLAGFPFLAGFYSKDLIIELASVVFEVQGIFCYFISVFAAVLTVFYSVRLLFLVFLDVPKGFYVVYSTGRFLNEGSLYISIVLFVLSFCSIFTGFFFKDFFVGSGTLFWGNSIVSFSLIDSFVYYEFIPFWLKLLPLVGCLFGLVLCFVFYDLSYGFLFFLNKFFFFKLSFYREFDDIYYRYGFGQWRHDMRIRIILFLYNRFFFGFFYNFVLLYDFFSKKWYFDFLVNKFCLNLLFSFSFGEIFVRIEKGLFEILGAYGLFYSFQKYTAISKRFQSGFLFTYVFMYIMGFVGILVLFFFFKFSADLVFIFSVYLVLYYKIIEGGFVE